jgi:DNA-binding CsgD family transcriptional regulator
MAQLSAKDLHAALDFVNETHSFDDLGSFRSGILPGLERLVPSDLVGYNEVEPGSGQALVVTHPEPLPDTGEALARLAHQHPLISVQMNGDNSTYKISDFLSQRQFHSLELYNDLYRRIGAEDQIAFGLPGPVVIGIAMNRDRRSFRERDRAMLDLLGPHLARAHGRVLELMQMDAMIAMLEQGLRESGTAILALELDGGIAATSGPAIMLMREYFPGGRGAVLPPEVATWLDGAAADGPGTPSHPPLTIEGKRGRLTIRKAHHRASDGILLVLEERPALTPEALRPLGLTRRQAEVLCQLAAGRRVEEIANALFISPRTVRKHLEHVYERLGVHSRAAAVSMAREAARRPGV